jgi:hypothetical protein
VSDVHGLSLYHRRPGCRCEICKAANAAASRVWRAGHSASVERPTPYRKIPTWEMYDYPPTLGEYRRIRESA